MLDPADYPIAAREPGVLKAIRAEARYAERVKVLDLLSTAMLQARRDAGNVRAGTNTAGRKATGLQGAIDLLRLGVDVEPGEQWSSLVTDCDSVDLFAYDPADVDEPTPVRLVVHDGGELVSAAAYLTLGQAGQVSSDLTLLVAKLRADRAARAAEGAADGQVAT